MKTNASLTANKWARTHIRYIDICTHFHLFLSLSLIRFFFFFYFDHLFTHLHTGSLSNSKLKLHMVMDQFRSFTMGEINQINGFWNASEKRNDVLMRNMCYKLTSELSKSTTNRFFIGKNAVEEQKQKQKPPHWESNGPNGCFLCVNVLPLHAQCHFACVRVQWEKNDRRNAWWWWNEVYHLKWWYFM